MDIIGIHHASEMLEPLDKYLKESYPRGIESMALEIHSREKLSSSQEGCFFSRLGNLWQDR